MNNAQNIAIPPGGAGVEKVQPGASLSGRHGRVRRQAMNSVLGLAFDGSKMQAVVVRRTNGSVEVRTQLTVSLSLNLLTDDPVLVGREIQKHLTTAGIRERVCVVGLPLDWALTLSTKLPDIPESDLASFLQIEAERGFPYPPEALMLASSRYKTPAGEAYALQVAVPREHVTRLETVLRAAQLKPVSFSLGITSFQIQDGDPNTGVIVLLPGERHLGMQVSFGPGIAVLRTIEGVSEQGGVEDGRFHVDHITRELRISLGQLPLDAREVVKRVRVYGHDDAAEELAEQLRPKLEPLGVSVEHIRCCPADKWRLSVPDNTEISPPLALAVLWLSGEAPVFEFLPPRLTFWQQLASRYASRKLITGGIIVGALLSLVLAAFGIQQVRLEYWRSKWNAIRLEVARLEHLQEQIVQYRPWFDRSCRVLTLLRRLSEVFPEDGSVSAKTIHVREGGTVTVTGTARSNQALLRVLQQLRDSQGIRNVELETMRGQTPLQFTFRFQWNPPVQP